MEIVKRIVMKKISEIKPYVRNPRKNDKTVNLLVEIIPKVGFNVPLVIDRNGVIVKGHARYAAAIRLGMEEVPCVVTDADEETIKLDRLADNRISEFSEWINDELLHEIDMLNLDFDFDLESQLPAMTLMPTPFSMMGWSVNPKRIVAPDTKPIWITPQRRKHRMLQSLHRNRWTRQRQPL